MAKEMDKKNGKSANQSGNSSNGMNSQGTNSQGMNNQVFESKTPNETTDCRGKSTGKTGKNGGGAADCR